MAGLAYLCFTFAPITQPSILDMAGVCISVLSTCVDHKAWPTGYGLLNVLLISQPGSLDSTGECRCMFLVLGSWLALQPSLLDMTGIRTLRSWAIPLQLGKADMHY